MLIPESTPFQVGFMNLQTSYIAEITLFLDHFRYGLEKSVLPSWAKHLQYKGIFVRTAIALFYKSTTEGLAIF